MLRIRLIAYSFFTFITLHCVIAQTTSLISIGVDGKLVYTPDANGNIIPDYSAVGYQNGEVPIPVAPVVLTLSTTGGDNRSQIQSAIDQVEAMTPDANGIRGAILLNPGEFNVSGTLNINTSGVVLRGSGNGATETRIVATATSQHDLIKIQGGGTSTSSSTEKSLVGSYIPTGTKTFTVESGHSFAVGDRVMLKRTPKQAWIIMLGMHNLSQTDGADKDWTTSEYTMNYKRIVTAVSGNNITLDAPLVDPIDDQYASGSITKYTWNNRVENVGIENIRLQSDYNGDSDENHGWNAIVFSNAEHCWVTDVVSYYFGYSLVSINGSGSNISVLDSKCFDPKSQTSGGRKYSFNINGQRNLVKNCRTDKGRHDFVNGARTAGPNVFVNCVATDQKADIGPHHRWTTGALYDNVNGSFELNMQNRRNSGSGHGWTAAQCTYWNCTGSKFKVQSPPNHTNWAIGCSGTHTATGNYHTGNPGVWESIGSPIVDIPSLYERQLCERLGLEECGGNTCQPATASSNDGNIPSNVLDNDFNTRWSATGDGEHIEFCFGEELIPINGIGIAFYLGDQRSSTFDLLASEDGETWTTIQLGLSSSGASLDIEQFDFDLVWLTHLRIVGHGNSVNAWNSITEVSFNREEIPFNDRHPIPGTIQAEEYDLGGEGYGYHDDTPLNEGEAFRTDDVDVQITTDLTGGYNVGWISTDEWLAYAIDVATTGEYDITLRTASAGTGGEITFVIDGSPIASTVLPVTGDWQSFESTTIEKVQLAEGEHRLQLMMTAGSFNLNYVTFTPSLVMATDDLGNIGSDYLYPNPFNETLIIKDCAQSQLEIVDGNGKIVLNQNINSDVEILNTQHLSPGIYSCKIQKGNEFKTLKVVRLNR